VSILEKRIPIVKFCGVHDQGESCGADLGSLSLSSEITLFAAYFVVLSLVLKIDLEHKNNKEEGPAFPSRYVLTASARSAFKFFLFEHYSSRSRPPDSIPSLLAVAEVLVSTGVNSGLPFSTRHALAEVPHKRKKRLSSPDLRRGTFNHRS